MILRCVFLLVAVSVLSACGGSPDVDMAVKEVVAAVNEDNPAALKKFKIDKAAAEKYFDALVDSDEALRQLKDRLDFEEIWEDDWGNEEYGWDQRMDVNWPSIKARLNEGMSFDLANLEYEVVKDDDNPWQMVVVVETGNAKWPYLMFKLLEFNGAYHMHTPYDIGFDSDKEDAIAFSFENPLLN